MPLQGWFDCEEALAGIAVSRDGNVADMDGGDGSTLELFWSSSEWRSLRLPELPLCDGDPARECGAEVKGKGGRRLLAGIMGTSKSEKTKSICDSKARYIPALT